MPGRGRGVRGGAQKTRPVVDDAWIDSIVEPGVRSSSLKSEQAKASLAETWRALLQEQERLRALGAAGRIGADEARMISSVATGLRKTIEALGLIEHREEETEF